MARVELYLLLFLIPIWFLFHTLIFEAWATWFKKEMTINQSLLSSLITSTMLTLCISFWLPGENVQLQFVEGIDPQSSCSP